MKTKFFPTVGIVVMAILLIIFNETSESNIFKDYALGFIIAGMFFGYFLAKIFSKPKDLNN